MCNVSWQLSHHTHHTPAPSTRLHHTSRTHPIPSTLILHPSIPHHTLDPMHTRSTRSSRSRRRRVARASRTPRRRACSRASRRRARSNGTSRRARTRGIVWVGVACPVVDATWTRRAWTRIAADRFDGRAMDDEMIPSSWSCVRAWVCGGCVGCGSGARRARGGRVCVRIS